MAIGGDVSFDMLEIPLVLAIEEALFDWSISHDDMAMEISVVVLVIRRVDDCPIAQALVLEGFAIIAGQSETL